MKKFRGPTMSISYINTGTSANSGNGDSIRLAFTKVNQNFEFLQSTIDNIEFNTSLTLNNLTVTNAANFLGGLTVTNAANFLGGLTVTNTANFLGPVFLSTSTLFLGTNTISVSFDEFNVNGEPLLGDFRFSQNSLIIPNSAVIAPAAAFVGNAISTYYPAISMFRGGTGIGAAGVSSVSLDSGINRMILATSLDSTATTSSYVLLAVGTDNTGTSGLLSISPNTSVDEFGSFSAVVRQPFSISTSSGRSQDYSTGIISINTGNLTGLLANNQGVWINGGPDGVTIANENYGWQFNAAGELVFPDGSVQSTASTPSGGSGYQLNSGTSTLILNGSGSLTFPDGTIQYTAANRPDRITSGTSALTLASNGVLVLDQAGAYDGVEVPGTLFRINSDYFGYSEMIVQNLNSGVRSTSDLLFVRDNGNAAAGAGMLDIGINSSNYIEPDDYGLHTVGSAYIFTNDADLFIGTQSPGTRLTFHSGGSSVLNNVGYVDENAWNFNRNVNVEVDLTGPLNFTVKNTGDEALSQSIYQAINNLNDYLQMGINSSNAGAYYGAIGPRDGFLHIDGSTATLHIGSGGDLRFWSEESTGGYNSGTTATLVMSKVDRSSTFGGHVLPAEDLTYDLGSTTTQWRSIYVGTGTIYIGGVALGVSSDNYVTVDGNPIVTVNTAGSLTIQGGTAIVGSVTVSDTAPTATEGALWFNGVEGRMYVAYNGQWVDSSPTVVPAPSTYLDEITIDGSTLNINGGTLTISNTGTLLINGSEVTSSSGATDRLTTSSYSLILEENGTLTFPSGLTASPISNFIPVSGTVIQQTENELLQVISKGSTGGMIVGWAENPFEPSQVAAISFNANSEGEVLITSGNYTGTVHTWAFSTTGTQTLPGGGSINGADYDVEIVAGNDGSSTYGHVTLKTSGPLGVNEFYMNSLGELTLPRGGVIQETEVTNELWGTTTTSLTLVPAGAANGTQRLEIYSTGGGEGNHIHITSGDQNQTDLFLGNDTQYFAVGAMGQIQVQARPGSDSPIPGSSAGAGSPVFITAGDAGDNGGDTMDGAAGGDIQLQAGYSSNGLGGQITLLSAGGPNGYGSVKITTNSGSSYWEFDKDSVLTLPAMGGNEGAEINFTKSPNSTLSGNAVVVDQYIDRLRIFESSGTNRGVYIDLNQAADSVGTLLNNRVAALVNAGTFVTMDNIKATVTTSGQRGLSLATVTGFFTYNIGGTFGGAGVGSGGSSASGQTLTTTPTGSIFGWGFTTAGDIATYIITNTSSLQTYRITLQIGASFNNNMISIERLV